MLHKLLRAFITILGTMAIPGMLMLMQVMYQYIRGRDLFYGQPAWAPIVVYMVAGFVSGLIFFFWSNNLAQTMEKAIGRLKTKLNDAPSLTLLSGGIGLIIGLIVAALFSIVIGLIPIAWVSVPLIIIFYIIFGYLGATIGIERRSDVAEYFSKTFFGRNVQVEECVAIRPKILDTSIIIDGRIFDVLKTGVLEGEIIVPSFVLQDLQRIADSDDTMKRSRGRRGLHILERMQSELAQPIQVVDKEYENTHDVDVKVIKLARDMGGEVITTDFSLNKVASVQDIPVFNINELANALKPNLAAGETLRLRIVRDGKEPNQGIGYLDDGTMIVVEGASGMVDSEVDVCVTSVLQTAAGRMIFAKIHDEPGLQRNR